MSRALVVLFPSTLGDGVVMAELHAGDSAPGCLLGLFRPTVTPQLVCFMSPTLPEAALGAVGLEGWLAAPSHNA